MERPGKPAEASLDWKPIAHTVLGPGIEHGMHWCKAREVPLRYLLPPHKVVNTLWVNVALGSDNLYNKTFFGLICYA